MATSREKRRERIKKSIKKRRIVSAERPRLSVFRSNAEIYAQIIDDTKGRTLVAACSLEKDIREQKITKTEKSKLVGKRIAERAKEKGITKVWFDRGGFLYHGRVKALAEAAREGGLEF
ncbi:MAG: 50S ribosomal protein L18 [Bacteroidia bacterium]|nr:50S ribosomal protein L18 [Bacteroidia bacterium]MDW8301297.1 50S ribosomal protein L18 [Bacteroidia bacterium]